MWNFQEQQLIDLVPNLLTLFRFQASWQFLREYHWLKRLIVFVLQYRSWQIYRLPNHMLLKLRHSNKFKNRLQKMHMLYHRNIYRTYIKRSSSIVEDLLWPVIVLLLQPSQSLYVILFLPKIQMQFEELNHQLCIRFKTTWVKPLKEKSILFSYLLLNIIA